MFVIQAPRNKMLRIFLPLFFILTALCEGKLPELTPIDVTKKAKEIMEAHACEKELTPPIVKRALQNYLESLDPTKTYFIASDVALWTNPSDVLVSRVIDEFDQNKFSVFEEMHQKFIQTIARRHSIENEIKEKPLPTRVRTEEFKDMMWVTTKEELTDRIMRMRGLQQETVSKLSDDMREKSIQRIAKRQAKHEEEMTTEDPQERKKMILSYVLKSIASSLDTHTAYFTPAEAAQFMIHVQQRFFGIGAQLRDDINGFTIVKMVEGGPAILGKQLKNKDRIVAINGEPVVGMDIADVVEMIHGEAGTPVALTVIRETKTNEGVVKEEKLDFTILRGEVIVKENRFKVSHEPFGDGVIGYLKLYSFYQDNGSSASDLEKEIVKLKKEHNLRGIVLDLRYNTGGLISQAVGVAGLFIGKGIVVSIKDEAGKIQHLRNLDASPVWDGPLIVLVNRMSASASEIVAQTLQDYGRALIVGDDRTFGKGSYQTFTLGASEPEGVDPQGEYKVTRGRYYTVSGKSPQLTGVLSDVILSGPVSESDVGESFAKYPLSNEAIKPNFDDDLSDVPYLQRGKIKRMYKFGLQEKMSTYQPYLDQLRVNASSRVLQSCNYQNFIKEIQKKEDADPESAENFGCNDLQLEHAYHLMKDLIFMMEQNGIL